MATPSKMGMANITNFKAAFLDIVSPFVKGLPQSRLAEMRMGEYQISHLFEHRGKEVVMFLLILEDFFEQEGRRTQVTQLLGRMGDS